MSKTLIIVESPSKAHKIQDYLGQDYIVMASYGHITDLAKGGKHGIGVDIDNNFKPHYVLQDDKIKVLDDLLNAAKKADLVLLFGDNDREGTAISYQIKQRLDGIKAPMKRGVFNEITKKAILKAISEACDIDMNIVHSQEARRILDRIVGFKASPLLMNFFGGGLSAGRVQSVLTRMIIDREQEIQSFVPENYWTIQITLAKDQEDKFITKYSGKLDNQTSADSMKAKLLAGQEYIVSQVLAEEEKKYPEPPLVTSSLQRLMSRVHGFGADRTMKAAQSLYESGCCTYIRTDSVRVGDEALSDVRQWISDNSFELLKKPNVFKNKDAAQDAHECIRPSDLNLTASNNFSITDPDQKLVYEAIWKNFIASQMAPAIFNTLKVTAHIKGDKLAEVKASGKSLKSKGYLEILGIDDNSKIDIPNLSKGDILNLFGASPVKMEKKQTQPLPRYSEDKLIKELVNKNIGRPATYADLLSKVTTRNYVEKKGNVYHATDLGKKITNVLTEFFTFMDYNYTSELEKKLDDIESGKINHIDMLKDFYPKFQQELNAAYHKYGGTICDKCGNPMVTRTAKLSGEKFLACSIYSCKNTKNIK